MRTDGTGSTCISFMASRKGADSSPKRPSVLNAAERTSASASARSSTTSSASEAPRSPIPPSAVAAAALSLTSSSYMRRATSGAYTWPLGPRPGSANTRAHFTELQRSLKHLTSLSVKRKTFSPIMPSAVQVSERIDGCWLERSATTAWTVEREAPPDALPIIPKATTAEETTRTSLSERSPKTSDSFGIAAAPITPSALAADALTSAFSSSSNLATLSK
mmetsp:Transcript_25903/g.54706  ORF Transcript_25903/g.54706 Transcript_25903/m.54706 type:complete len:220 (+) Transcript_25903:245-904(+)